MSRLWVLASVSAHFALMPYRTPDFTARYVYDDEPKALISFMSACLQGAVSMGVEDDDLVEAVYLQGDG